MTYGDWRQPTAPWPPSRPGHVAPGNAASGHPPLGFPAPGHAPGGSQRLGTLALVLGIVALVTTFAFPLVGALVAPWWAPPLLGVGALAVGIRGMRDHGAGRRRAAAGAIIGGIAVGMSVVFVALVVAIGAAGGL